MGAVYAGTHVELGRPVALKFLLPDFLTDQQALERFRRAARAAARLNHPNVADIYHYGTLPGGEAYLVMELVKGLTLRQYLRLRAPLPFADAIKIAWQVGNGVEAAHQGGIIHRDLKPSNIILTRIHIGRLHAKIVDFGVAKLKEQMATGEGSLTATGSFIGTPRYMSPEQCAGYDLDERSDIYSLGVILYEMVAGQAPFNGPTAIAIALKHIKEPPPPLKKFRPDVPEPLTHLVMESLHVNPSARPQTAAEYARRLRHIEYLMGLSAFDAPEAGADSPDIPLNVAAPPPPPNQTFQAAGLACEGEGGDEMQGRRANLVVASAAEDAASLPDDGAVPPSGHAAPDAVTKAAAPSSAPADLLRRPAADPESPSQAPVMAAVIGARSPVYRPHLLVSAGLAVVAALCLVLLWLAPSRTPSGPLTAQATPTPSPKAQGDEPVKRLPPAVVESASKKVPKTPPRGQERPSSAVIDKRPPAAVTGETVAGEKAAGGLPRAKAEAERAHLRASLDEWVRATNARNIRKQMAFYPRLVPAFYLWRNVSQHAVLAEKTRLFGRAKVIDVRTGPPQITVAPDGNTATMRFRKQYVIEGARENRRGEVLQELRWQKTEGGWKIISERDLRVIR
ncbi:MAG: serine/threonine protein kinase [Gammaproteobacteria bacterium]|nr:serine/threonine protein kinase [Gammaproteobacteria bacterium]